MNIMLCRRADSTASTKDKMCETFGEPTFRLAHKLDKALVEDVKDWLCALPVESMLRLHNGYMEEN